MFGTLHYNASRNEAQYVERSNGVVEHGGNAAAHFACDNCRAKKLKCDGQKQGCFRCKASSAPCHYTRYSTKRECQRKLKTSQSTKSVTETFTQNQNSHNQQIRSDGLVSGREVCTGTNGMSARSFSDDMVLQDKKAREGTILNSDTTQELDEDERILFDQPLPDLVSESGLESEDPFGLDFGHSNTDDITREKLDDLGHQLPSPDLSFSSPHFSSLLSSFISVDSSPPQWLADDEEIRTHPPSSPLTSILLSGSKAQGPNSPEKRAVCQCSQVMITLLGESESRSNRVDVRNMHTIIAYVKNTLEQCIQVLNCKYCSLLSDHMMLAAVVISKLVFIMEEVFHVYIQRRTPRSDLDHQSNCWSLCIGEYMIDSEGEWAAVMKVLIVGLLKRTLDTLNCLKRVAKANLREAQISMLNAAEQKALKVALSMQSGDVGACRK